MSESSQSQTEAAESAGTQLREERKRQQLSIGDVSRHLKLSIRQVEALETNDFEQFGGSVFVHGFLRNYAKLLGLQVAPLIHAADLKLKPASGIDNSSDIQAPQRNSRDKGKLLLVIAVGVLLVAVFAWMLFTDAPLLPSGSVVEKSTSVDEEINLTASTTEPGDMGGVEEIAVLTEPGAEMATETDQLPRNSIRTTPQLRDSVVNLVFDEESWIEVTDRYGAVLASGIVAANASRSISGQAPLTVVIGNAAGARLMYNNKAVDLAPHTRADVARLTLE